MRFEGCVKTTFVKGQSEKTSSRAILIRFTLNSGRSGPLVKKTMTAISVFSQCKQNWQVLRQQFVCRSRADGGALPQALRRFSGFHGSRAPDPMRG